MVRAATVMVLAGQYAVQSRPLLPPRLLPDLRLAPIHFRRAWREEVCSVPRPGRIVAGRIAGGVLELRERRGGTPTEAIGRFSVGMSALPA